MLRERGTVVETSDEGIATVLVSRDQECSNCGTCNCSQDEKKNKSSSFELKARSEVGVTPGDFVEVHINQSLVKLSFITFGIPAMAVLIGIGLADLMINVLALEGIKGALRGGFAGGLFLLSIAGVKLYDSSLARDQSDRVKIVRKLGG